MIDRGQLTVEQSMTIEKFFNRGDEIEIGWIDEDDTAYGCFLDLYGDPIWLLTISADGHLTEEGVANGKRSQLRSLRKKVLQDQTRVRTGGGWGSQKMRPLSVVAQEEQERKAS